ncbi:MAG: tetratricopeptide repeat protein, partial [Chloroflexota bacterium]
ATAIEQYENALADYDEALRLMPDYAFIYGNRGEVLFMLGRYDEALENFHRAHQMVPRLRRAVAGMAIALHALGRTLDSINVWNHLLEQDTCYYDANWVQAEHDWSMALTNEVRGLLADLDPNS